ncbi:MAG: rod shape determining protein RodA [Planctomycetota bacterium]|jgi:rod shape determining protein RodA
MNERRVIVFALALLAFMLALAGLLIQTSILEVTGDFGHRTQWKWVFLSCAAAGIVPFLQFRMVMRRSYDIFVLTLILLALVPLIGVSRNFSQRWLEIGGFSLQPSELMKIAFVLALARLLRFRGDFSRFRNLVPAGALVALPVGLIFAQPDLSTAILFVPTALSMLFVAGAEKKHIGMILCGGALAASIVFAFFLEPYQRERVFSTFGSNTLTKAERAREGYQLEQSINSIAIGGFTGQGWSQGTQNRLNKLPYRHNDFIFAVLAEEFGFLGCTALFACILLLLLLVLRVAYLTRDVAGRLTCVGLGTMFACQSLVHIGVNLGIVPTTGMTLPFVSAGGTSLLTFSVAVSIVASIAKEPARGFGGPSVREQLARLEVLAGIRKHRNRPVSALQHSGPMVESKSKSDRLRS